FVELARPQLVGQRTDSLANHQGGERALELGGDLLGCRHGFEARLVPLAFALFGDEENAHESLERFLASVAMIAVFGSSAAAGRRYKTRASNLSFSTSFAAASFGVPLRNSVFFALCGT